MWVTWWTGCQHYSREVQSFFEAKTLPQSSVDVSPRLESAIEELQRLHEVLLSGDVDARILTDFRDALNRVRNTAWAAQQYVTRKETNLDSCSVLSLLAGERIRAVYHLSRAIGADLARTDIDLQAGTLIQLYEVTSQLKGQLEEAIRKF